MGGTDQLMVDLRQKLQELEVCMAAQALVSTNCETFYIIKLTKLPV